MRIKSYFSPTVEAAISEARRELGPEAVLVSTRSAPPDAKHLGRYEVVFGSLEPSAQEDSRHEDSKVLPGPRASMADELTELRKQIEGLCQSVQQNGVAAGARPPLMDNHLSCLVDNGIPSAQARSVIEAAAKRVLTAEEKVPAEQAHRRAVAAELESRISVTGGLPVSRQRNVFALIGPSGAGKTDALAKLAVAEGFARNRPVRLLTTDCERVAASARLNCFATILGLPLQTCESPVILEAALRRKQDRELVLIDTPGYSPVEMGEAKDLGMMFLATKEIVPVLVLPATMKADDMEACVQRFAVLGPKELLFTRLDETQTFGSLWNTAAVSKLPISFFGTGQQIPDDLEVATPGKMSFLLLAGGKARVSNAA